MTAPVDLAQYTGYLLRRAQQMHAALWQREVGSRATSVQFGVLSMLSEHPGIDQVTLCEHLQTDRSTMAELIARLEKRDEVTRAKDDTDRRRNIVTLTPTGERTLRELRPQAERVNEILTAGLGEADQQHLQRLLVALLESPPAPGILP